MKKILSIAIALMLLAASAYAETRATAAPTAGASVAASPTDTQQDTANAVYDLYDFAGDGTLDVESEYWVEFEDVFKIQMPAGWKNFALTDAQKGNNMIACFGDGTHFVFVGREADTGAYADMTEYEMTLALDESNVSFFDTAFNGTAFICYSDYENQSSNCATLVSGKGIYTFYFYPSDGDTAFAQTVIDLMNTYTALEAAN